jgi:chemotaxis protein histidine kinase CheA
MSKKLVVVDPKEYGLEPDKAKEVESVFLPIIAERESLEETYLSITSKKISPELTQEARELRLKLVKVRTNTDKIHKSAKAFYLAGGKFVDAWKNKNVTVIEQMEEKLFDIEKYYEQIESERKKALKQKRADELCEFGVDFLFYKLDDMPEDTYQQLLATSKENYRLKKEAEQKAEDERLAKEQAEKEEQERIRVENERLKAEAALKEKELAIERAKVEAEQKKAAEKAAEEVEKIRKENERILKEERATKLKLEAELKAKEEEKSRLEKLEKDKKEAEEKARKAEEKKARLAPDKQKIESLAVKITEIELPSVKSEEAKKIVQTATELLNKVVNYLKEQSCNL